MLKRVSSMLFGILSGILFGVLLFSEGTLAATQATYGYDVPIDIVVNGVFLDNGAKGSLGYDGVTYVPVKEFFASVGAVVSSDESGSTVFVRKDGKSFKFNGQGMFCVIDGKISFPGLRYKNGILYAPARFISEILGGTTEWDSYRCQVEMTVPGLSVKREFAEKDYNAEDLLWLSRIVTCEAGSVSFEAKVMVANVIINRRSDKSFPNTVKDVIFDKKFGIQFPPAHNGRIYNIPTPSTHTIMACKAALNGLELAPDCLYFSYTSDNFSWVYHNRKLYTTIGNQAFYL